jgi:AhpD family alkylhydroperoxidase
MSERLEQFRAFRERMNARIHERGTLTTKRFFNLDGRCYETGALPVRTKEMLGLATSLVLRCDDCVAYHVIRCLEEGVTEAELMEVFDVGLIVGGSIVVPHLRRAHALLAELLAEGKPEGGWLGTGGGAPEE